MGRRQKGKGKKRLRSWHSGRNQGYNWLNATKKLPPAPSSPEPDTQLAYGGPEKIRRGAGKQWKGDVF